MISTARLSGLIARVYDAVLEAPDWPGVLDEIAATFHAESAAIGRFHLASGELALLDAGTSRSAEIPAVALPLEREARRDASSVFLSRTRVGLAPVLGGVLARDASGSTVISIQRTPTAAPFDAADGDALAKLLPHLARARALLHRFGREQLHAAGAAQALELSRYGVLILDQARQPVFANQTAVALCKARSGLDVSRAPLRRLVDRAFAGESGALVLAATARSTAVQVVILPMWIDVPSIAPPAASGVFVFLIDEANTDLPDLSHLAQLYGLTAAETAVAGRILAGRTRKQAAADIGIGDATAKTQLDRVYAKTGVDGQLALLRLMSGIEQLRIGGIGDG